MNGGDANKQVLGMILQVLPPQFTVGTRDVHAQNEGRKIIWTIHLQILSYRTPIQNMNYTLVKTNIAILENRPFEVLKM